MKSPVAALLAVACVSLPAMLAQSPQEETTGVPVVEKAAGTDSVSVRGGRQHTRPARPVAVKTPVTAAKDSAETAVGTESPTSSAKISGIAATKSATSGNADPAVSASVSVAGKQAAGGRVTVIRPTIPQADRHEPGKVFIEYADVLDKPRGEEAQILIGNVQFRKGDMFMYCDSARFYEETSSLEAYRNVRMEQGDTLFVYGDELYYDGEEELAELRAYPGKDVRLINRDVTLTTPVFFYDIPGDVGYYMTGGKLDDKTNTLTSQQGFYYPATKDAFFYMDVELNGPRQNDTLRMYTDSLTYNTNTAIAQLMCATRIVSKDGEIHSTSGFYDTRTGIADLYERSTVYTKRGNTLTGDTLFYDRDGGFGEAFGNMIFTDSVNQSSLSGDYGYYDEVRDSAFVTGNALAMEYSRGDTLYLHGDTITAYAELPDSMKVTNAYHRVRFFRKDIQGLCDSMSMVQRDSILYMYYNPIVWSDDKQVVGNLIWVHLNDSSADWARLPEIGLMAQHVGEDCYNQLGASDMTVWMADTTITRMYAEGNVQTIMFPMEADSTYNKFSFTESSYMDVNFKDGDIEHLVMWPETTGKVTPLYLAKRSNYYLAKFRWYGPLRPMAPDEVFDYPPEMADLARQNLLGRMSADALTMRGRELGKPAPQLPVSLPDGAVPSEGTADAAAAAEQDAVESDMPDNGEEPAVTDVPEDPTDDPSTPVLPPADTPEKPDDPAKTDEPANLVEPSNNDKPEKTAEP
ncbi:MAG: LPS export ABC transporter periplasmic protein LptC [Duncaniella sp.]|nr:LPS export ABC transporter periplasmic protein LptC [Duncaniella sp.]